MSQYFLRDKSYMKNTEKYHLYCSESVHNRNTIVFLPGLGGTTRYWQSRIKLFEQSYNIVLIDLLGFGQSKKPWIRYTIDRHIDALHNTLASYDSFILVGHSMGAILSIAYAARYPEQVKRLILISLPYFGNKEKAIGYFRRGPWPDRWFLTNMAFAAITCILTRRVFGWLLPYILRDLPHEVAEDLVKHSWLSFTSSLWEVVYTYDLASDAAALGSDIPVFCLHGDSDRTAPLEGILKLLGEYRSWKIEIIAGADHHPLLRKPVTCIQALQTVLRN